MGGAADGRTNGGTGWVRGLDEVDRTQVAAVGGKAANLGELAGIDGVRVPAGFCVTTDAYRRATVAAPSLGAMLDRLGRADPETARTVSAEIRQVIEELPLPAGLAAAIDDALRRLGAHDSYAVRSSATAEDLPTASFAGQQDSFLNVVGPAAIRRHVSRCWASLFTERAVSYRQRNGIDHRRVRMAVVVQRMLAPDVAGVLFTADPVTSNRTVATVEAVPGLGEALVSGRVDADSFRVRDDAVVARTLASHRERPSLTDAQVLRLVRLGRRIEAHAGHPQDIEWCLVGEDLHVVQSRPVTTLFPVPPADDRENHVYVSVGHQQMMTDPMKPLGLSFWQLTTPRPMAEAGGRLFVDITRALASEPGRAALLDAAGGFDPLTRDALRTVLDRDGFLPAVPDAGPGAPAAGGAVPLLDPDPALVTELIDLTRASLAALRRDIRTVSGPALFEFLLADLGELRRILFDPRGQRVFTTAMAATAWLDEHLHAWLGETDAADTLARSVPRNVTSEMGLALLEVADVLRPYPEVVAFLERAADAGDDDGLLPGLARLAGGPAARAALETYLDTYGMRGVGEIDITRPRWSERPTALVPSILADLRGFEAGAGRRRFERGLQQARKKEREVLMRVRALPDGERKAAEVALMIGRLRTFLGYREYPKYGMVSRYLVYRQALLREADRLVEARTLRARDDIYYLRFEELHEVVRTNRVDHRLLRRRREEFRSYGALAPPRVLTSEGEALTGAYRRDDLPPGALAGLAVSAGTVEGRARVVLDLAHADLEAGDILVTRFTDPAWTPLFVAAGGLVTEVGGLMTHGAVVAREYGLPAVVGVERATELIGDGQRIRLHGTAGYVEILA